MSVSNRLLGGAAAAFDRAVVAAMEARSRRSRARAGRLTHEERLRRLGHVADAYAPALAGDFFPAPPAVTPVLRRVRPLPDGGEVVDATWPSTSEPWLDEIRAPYLAHERNRPAHARLYLGRGTRPAVVLIHGYLGGHWTVEEWAWPIAWMYQRCGFDVALALLPFHALRGRADGGPPPFPGSDPRFTNEGFRQAIADIRALIGVLRARGAPAVGVMGMSLGGYTTSLLATVENVAFAVPVIPLASIADFAREKGRLGEGPEAELQHRALERATWVVSPFARPPVVPADRILVVGAEADRITPIAHAERLARHLGAPLHRLPGGHLLQIGRGDAFRAARRLWRRIGLSG